MKFVNKRASSLAKATALVACGVLSAVISYGSPAYAAEQTAEIQNTVAATPIAEAFVDIPDATQAAMTAISSAKNNVTVMKANVEATVAQKGISKYAQGDSKYVENVLGNIVETGKSLSDEYAYEICKEVTKGTPDVTPEILYSLMFMESCYKPDAVNAKSGATGLCGIATLHADDDIAKSIGIVDYDKEINEPVTNAAMGARILQDFYNQYKEFNPTMGRDDLMNRALGSYSGYGKNSYYVKNALREETLVAGAMAEKAAANGMNAEVVNVNTPVAASQLVANVSSATLEQEMELE